MTAAPLALAPPLRAPRLQVAEYASFDEAADLRDEWDALVAETDGPIQLSFDHCRAWWARYGHGRTLHVFAFTEDGDLAGVLPFVAGTVRLGLVTLRVAALVGSDSTPVVLGLPVRGGHVRQALTESLRRLIGGDVCDAVRLGPLGGEVPHAEAALAAAAELGDAATVVRDAEVGPHTVFALPETFEEYQRSIGKRQRGNHRRALSALEDAHGVAWDVLDAPGDLEREFPRFREMHQAQWRAQGRLGHFGDWPSAAEYHSDLVRAHGAAGRVHLLRLSLGGEPVAYEYCWSFGRTLHWVLPARLPREDLARHSLGRLALVKLVEFAIRAGFTRIEGGPGHYDYKVQLGATEHAARSVVVARPGARGRVRTFLAAAQALDVAYRRVWFRRVAPRLPRLRSPLWEAWIRSRL